MACEKLYPFEGHLDYTNAVAFPLDGRLVASASIDITALFRDVVLGAIVEELKVNADIRNLSFFDDGTLLKTHGGLLHTTSLSASEVVSRQKVPRTIIFKEHKITQRIENILWLPPGC